MEDELVSWVPILGFAIRRTVSKPRLTVPTNLQRVTVVGMAALMVSRSDNALEIVVMQKSRRMLAVSSVFANCSCSIVAGDVLACLRPVSPDSGGGKSWRLQRQTHRSWSRGTRRQTPHLPTYNYLCCIAVHTPVGSSGQSLQSGSFIRLSQSDFSSTKLLTWSSAHVASNRGNCYGRNPWTIYIALKE